MELRDLLLHPIALFLSGVSLFLLGVPHTVAAQDSVQARCAPSREPLTAALLKRVSSAVDGYRNGRPVWVVVRDSAPYPILAVRYSCPEAARSVAGRRDRLLGPYVAPSDAENVPILFGVLCKAPDTSQCYMVDSLFIPPLPIDSIVRVTVTFYLKDGQTRVAVFKPDSVEAVFFTMSAVDKLLIPYYSFVHGIDAAKKLREEDYRFFTRRGRK